MKVKSLILIISLFSTFIFPQEIDLRDPSAQYDYVIITKETFQSEFGEFTEHKNNVKSLTCIVVNVEDIYNEFSEFENPSQSIRGFISFAGKNWPEPQPKYFLLAGDIDAIPNFMIEGVRETDTVFTDYYYAVDLDNADETKIDYYVGRISARTNTELSNYLSKIIDYESTPVDGWNNKIMIVGVDNESTGTLLKSKTEEFTNYLFDYLKPTLFLSPSMYDEDELRNNIINGINIEGYSSVFLWSAQSNNEVFGLPSILDVDNIDEINTEYSPFVTFLGQQKFSTSYSTGMLDQLLFNKNGAIAGINSVAPYYINTLTQFYFVLVKYLYSETGNSIAEAAAKTFDELNSSQPYYIKSEFFGVFGDPSLALKYDILAAVEEDKIVNEFELYQNYPNPFNPTTQISFSLPEKAFVQLKIFDVLGKEVATLINTEMSPGKHEIEFNGSSLSSGIYLYQIKAGIYNQVRKMLLVK